jgi:DNA polymerase I-like protein with 3'-5' exonuclease and polymerase domains
VPRRVVLDERESAHRSIDRIRAARPKALGIALQLRRPDGGRLRAGDDPRHATLDAIAIAAADLDEVLALEGDALEPASLHELLSRLALDSPEDRAPYLVFAHAQTALTMFAERVGIDAALPRFGCVTTAATLLAEGADRRRDHRPIDHAVREVLARDLPESLFGSESGERLACEAQALLALMQVYGPQLRERRLTRVFAFECELVPAVVAMERVGVGLDSVGFERIASAWERERDYLRLEGVPPPSPVPAEPSRDPHLADPSGHLDQLGARERQQVLDRVARLDKLISTYRYWARDFAVGERIHCRLHPLATDTGRFSCSDPNLQQVPGEHTAPGLRACFVPARDCALIVADYSQIELRVAAHLAPCEAMRAVFRAGRDPHRATAANLAGKPEHAIDDHERKLAKAVNFGFLFGMGAERFRSYAKDSYGLELDPQQAAEAREAFFRTFPGIAAWHRRVRGLARTGEHEPITVQTAMGRRRTFPTGSFSYNAALNIPVQGTAAEGFKLAMVRLHRELPQIAGRGVLVVHDEYLAEVPREHAERGRALVERIMIESMRELIDSIPILVDARVATCWS